MYYSGHLYNFLNYRLLVNLTSPANICFNKKTEIEEGTGPVKMTNTFQTRLMEAIGYLQAYKEVNFFLILLEHIII